MISIIAIKNFSSRLISGLQTVKWVQVFLFNCNYFIHHYSFICTQSNGSKYFYVISIIQFRHTAKEFQVLLFNTNNSSQHYSFICTHVNGSKYCYNSIRHQLFVYEQLNALTVLFLTIRFNIHHWFSHCLNVKQIYLTHSTYQILPLWVRVDLGMAAIIGYSTFPKAPRPSRLAAVEYIDFFSADG